jgi:hypothetical protein
MNSKEKLRKKMAIEKAVVSHHFECKMRKINFYLYGLYYIVTRMRVTIDGVLD